MQNLGEDSGQYECFQNQDFYTIRDSLLQYGEIFEDPCFKLDYQYEWLRPWQLSNNPQLFVDGITRFDINQGELGDCWMLASISALGTHPNLVKNVIPSDQSFESDYAGIFHFRLWRFGKWYDVVIDDRLPTRNGQLVFTRSGSRDEFWTALLEKAYCKAIGGEYKVADAGNLCEALEDFTGGVTEQYLLESVPWNFQNVLVKAMARSSLVGVFIDDTPGSSESHTPEGLVKGHSYSVTAAKQINLPGHGSITLVRVRNPWGKFEWTGPWSDNSPEWNSVPQSTKQQLGLVRRDDGEFWMSYSDFVSHYQWMDMCHLSPQVYIDNFGNLSNTKSWELNEIKGKWVRGVSAGGARRMYMNPQIRFDLSEEDDDNNDGVCSVLIALMQRSSVLEGNYLEIGFNIYQLVDFSGETLTRSFFRYNSAVANVPTKCVREVAGRFNLAPGAYCVVPFTYETGKDGKYLVRIYSEKRTNMYEMDSRIGLSPVDVIAHENPPMKIATKKVDQVKSEHLLKEQFNKVAGEDQEVDWKELKKALDTVVVNERTSKAEDKNHGWVNNVLSSVNTIFKSRKPQKINAYNTIGPKGFSNDVCRSMVALLDIDHSGKLGFKEYQDLWTEIKKWRLIYERHCEKSHGLLDSSGLRDALEASGFKFNKGTLSNIVHRYSTKDDKISFDDFLHCAIRINTVVKFFKTKEENDSHKAEFTLEDFIDKTLYT